MIHAKSLVHVSNMTFIHYSHEKVNLREILIHNKDEYWYTIYCQTIQTDNKTIAMVQNTMLRTYPMDDLSLTSLPRWQSLLATNQCVIGSELS